MFVAPIRPQITFRGKPFGLSKTHLHTSTEHDLPDMQNFPEDIFEIHLLHETFKADPADEKVVIAIYAKKESTKEK